MSGSKIIYASTRKNVENIVENLQSAGIDAIGYHAGLTSEERKSIQDSFIHGQYNLLVSTNAFGMGVDKADIRLIIHNNMPGSIEAYYQEIGRAGRDSKKSSCVLFYNEADRYIHEFFINSENPTKENIEEVYFTLINKSMSENKDEIFITTSEILLGMSYNVSDMTISGSLKELEKMELIKRNGESGSSVTIKLNFDYDDLIKQISPRAKSQIDLIITLKREYGLEKQGQEIEFNIDDFCKKTDTKRDGIQRTLNTLNKAELIEYVGAKRGWLIKILKKDLLFSVDEKELNEKKERALSKLNIMEEYAVTHVCRHKFILNYFEDNLDSVEDKCGMCDNCLRKMTGN
jgi:ATP-dependent DNA helicase RecQ